jgi:tripartite-type tricarboxylate transporter receptor subunit TctC
MLPFRSAAVLALALSASARDAKAEDFPERPVQMIVSVGAGGSTDTMMRALVQYAAPLLGQPIVIMNRPGASGMIGVARAVIAPAGVPADRLAKLKEVFSKAAQDPEFRKVALALGVPEALYAA